MPSQATARAAAGASATIVRRPRQPECSAIVWRRRAGSCRHQSAGVHPFFLEGVATDAKLNQADGLHPTAEGIDIIVKNILPSVEAFLGKLSAQRS